MASFQPSRHSLPIDLGALASRWEVQLSRQHRRSVEEARIFFDLTRVDDEAVNDEGVSTGAVEAEGINTEVVEEGKWCQSS